jgi:hypothetical protein
MKAETAEADTQDRCMHASILKMLQYTSGEAERPRQSGVADSLSTGRE